VREFACRPCTPRRSFSRSFPVDERASALGNAVGTSLALKSKDKGNWSSEGSVKITSAACEEHQKHDGGDHLLWIYWQETGGNVEKNTTAKQGMHARLDQFLTDIRDPKNNLPKPNVIGHDFVTAATCTKIVKMNQDVDAQF
jgi:hypothetical protein